MDEMLILMNSFNLDRESHFIKRHCVVTGAGGA
jgi:hypothetical protein